MATEPDAIILAALLDRLGQLVFTPALQIAMPGVDFPASGQTKPDNYLAAFFVPNHTLTRTVAQGRQQHRGILQVSVFWKKGVGHIKPLEAAGKVIDHYPKDQTFFSEGLKIIIDRKPWLAGPFQDTDRVHVPVSISYHCFAQ